MASKIELPERPPKPINWIANAILKHNKIDMQFFPTYKAEMWIRNFASGKYYIGEPLPTLVHVKYLKDNNVVGVYENFNL